MEFLTVYVSLVLVVWLKSGAECAQTSYHLKWVAKEPILPIFIEKQFDTALHSAQYRWFKYPQQVYVDELDDGKEAYIESSSEDRSILYIVEYNTTSHDVLAAYEPHLFADDGIRRADHKPELFSLAYVEGLSIMVTDEPNELIAHCNVSILLPNSEQLNPINIKLIEKSAHLKLGFSTASQHHYHQHKNTSGTKVRLNSYSKLKQTVLSRK